MTRDRRRKQHVRSLSTQAGGRYTRARRTTLPAPGLSIRDHLGEIAICGTCGQPAYDSTDGPSHFTEQTGTVYCPAFPRATSLLSMDWPPYAMSLETVRDEYPWPAAPPARRTPTMGSNFREYTGRVFVCASCGQPARNDDDYYGAQHFHDQWDGVFCDLFPLAGRLLTVHWHPRSLADWKAGYSS